MKTIELDQSNLTIVELIALAEEDTLILRKLDGSEFVLSAIDALSTEVETLSQNQEFMDFLGDRSRSTRRVSLEEARKRLGIASRSKN
jgi:hypothetical protein